VVTSLSTALTDPPYVQTTCGPFNPTEAGPQWTTCRLQFTARTASTTLLIEGTTGKQYIGLDRVSVECVAPLGWPGFCA
jgi:hypothetical protein